MHKVTKFCLAGDTPHEIMDVDLHNGTATLHRFNNAAGVPYSAIYEIREIISAPRDEEEELIKDYLENYAKY